MSLQICVRAASVVRPRDIFATAAVRSYLSLVVAFGLSLGSVMGRFDQWSLNCLIFSKVPCKATSSAPPTIQRCVHLARFASVDLKLCPPAIPPLPREKASAGASIRRMLFHRALCGLVVSFFRKKSCGLHQTALANPRTYANVANGRLRFAF